MPAQPIRKVDPTSQKKILPKKLFNTVRETHTEEIILGLCGPIGTDIHFVAKEIEDTISEKFGYECKIISLSSFIKDLGSINASNKTPYEVSDLLIEEGNKLRSEKGDSVLAELAINEIAVNRETLKNQDSDEGYNSKRVCYIIDSIKNNEELELFRLIYNNIFYFFGVYSNLEVREKNLERKGIEKPDIFKLIDRDSGEEISSGQKVANTFVQADFFLRIDQSNSNKINNQILRYLNLIFGTEIITPHPNETAMYQAYAAAGNSACLSRQVGAATTDKKGSIISIGWNDVPKFGGSVYAYNSSDPLGEGDHRCLNQEGGMCFNDFEKRKISKDLVKLLIDNGLSSTTDSNRLYELIEKSRIKELIEFSRAVHAEMLAIIHAGKVDGARLDGGRLFCTTYPCHNCARHILAAGISEVYYIEPYRKSLATKLHHDSITENESDTSKLRILLYDGVSPRRYLELFKMGSQSRKESGRKKKIDKKTTQPKNTLSLQAIPILEKKVLESLSDRELITINNDKE